MKKSMKFIAEKIRMFGETSLCKNPPQPYLEKGGSNKPPLAPMNRPSCGRGSCCVSESELQMRVRGNSHYKPEKAAFTLAEVLITLAVIGIVAALTIPPLIQSYKKQVASTRLKKFYSTMEQAIKLSEIDNGPIKNWKKEKAGSAKDGEHAREFYTSYIKPYLRVTDEDFDGNIVYLSDGSTFGLRNGDCIDLDYDINGRKSPNIYGKDIFIFLICVSDNIWGFSNNQPLKPYAYRDVILREKLLELCKSSARYCSGLLMYDNFEFKDDYPYKL